MGLFSFLKDAAIEANEEAHGARLLSNVQSIFPEMEGVALQVQWVAMVGYLQIRERLQNEAMRLSRDERIKLGKIMQEQALEQFKFDMAGGYAKLLAGAWLESRERNSLKAQQAFGLLDAFADYASKSVDAMK